MISEGFKVLLFGMAGIFIVMGIIIIAIQLLSRASGKNQKKGSG